MKTIPTRKEIVAQVKEAGLRVAAIMPIHYPRELLRAFGFHPMEVWGPPGVDPADAVPHFQAYTCGIVRNASAFLLQGKLDVADVFFIPHTCDALQGMASVLKDFVKLDQHVLTLYLPRAQRDSDLEFLTAELRRLGKQLSELSQKTPTNDDLLKAVIAEEQADQTFASLALDRAAIDLSDREYYALLRSREYLPIATFVELAESAPRSDAGQTGTPLMLSGIISEPMELFDRINEMGGRVVADDLACASRRIYPAGTSKDPYRRMAERLTGAPLDPTRGSPIIERAEALVKRMKATGARGLLVYDVKFCEPELFDLPQVRKVLSEQGLQFLHVEVDLSETLSNQALTRIEAFVEMLA